MSSFVELGKLLDELTTGNDEKLKKNKKFEKDAKMLSFFVSNVFLSERNENETLLRRYE